MNPRGDLVSGCWIGSFGSAIRGLPISPPDDPPETPEFAIDDQIGAYLANAGDLADLLSGNHALLGAVVAHVLADVDGIEVHLERLIRDNPAAMERIVREAEESLRYVP